MQLHKKVVKLKQPGESTSSREDGMRARENLLATLSEYDQLELDFSDLVLTPSFADSCIAMLAKQIGKTTFETKVVMTHTSPDQEALLTHVIQRRLAEKK